MADHVAANPPAKPWQFRLWQLFAVMAAVCLLGASYQWLGAGVILLGLLLVVVVGLGLVISRKKSVEILVCAVAAIGMIWLLLPALGPHRESARRSACQNNLKQIGIALQNYHDVYGSLPPAYIADKSGRPLHSWRVLILPFMEHKWLYDKYRFDEPWDGPNNSKLATEVLKLYSCPSDGHKGKGTSTSYAVVVGNGTAWPGTKSVKLEGMQDGSSNTILVVEVHNSGIHWMEPRDLHVSQMAATINPPRGQGISSGHKGGANVGLADGSIKFVPETTPPQTVRAMLTIAGGESVKLP